jgi:predicted small lipoprotein YifL
VEKGDSMKKTSLFCGILLIALALVSCGQKGALYLPQPAKPNPDASNTASVPAAKQDASGN